MSDSISEILRYPVQIGKVHAVLAAPSRCSLREVIINGKLDPADKYSAYSGYAHLAAGLTVGMSSLAAGLAIGIVGDAGVRANAQQPRLFVGMILILIFAEALGLYGLIVGLVVASTAGEKGADLCTSFK